MSGFRAAIQLTALRQKNKNTTNGGAGRHRRVSRSSSKILDAVALQDQLSRHLSLRPRRSRERTFVEVDTNWICGRCTLQNEGSLDTCTVCRAKRTEEGSHVTDVNYVPPRMTLAQKRGLAAAPPPRLTRSEWNVVEKDSMNKKYSCDVCPICREQFKTDQQVILSCGHVFHYQCLRSFEKFTQASKRSCPICRKANYQKKICTAGANFYKQSCACKLQSCIRAYFDRQKFRERVRALCDSDSTKCPRLRKKFMLSQLRSVIADIGQVVDAQDAAVARLLEESDRKMAINNHICARYRRKGKGCVGNATCGSDVDVDMGWVSICAKARARCSECPICMSSLYRTQKSKKRKDDTKQFANATILSCSHVFHSNCLASFESFNIRDLHLCPMCRSPYEKCPRNIQSRALDSSVRSLAAGAARIASSPRAAYSQN